MNTARDSYRVNHSDLRGLTRYNKDRAAKLKEVCDARKFWFGDTWAKPASLPAQAALRVLNGSLRDEPLHCNRLMREVKPEDRKIVAKVVLGALRVSKPAGVQA
jgi:hypothetical protein